MTQYPTWFNDWYHQSLANYRQLDSNYIRTEHIRPLNADLVQYSSLTNSESIASVAMVKLNGGLGTSMGCTGPKSLIKCSPDGRTFLDIIVSHYQQNQQITDLIFLNSFNTSQQTTDHLNNNYPSLVWSEVMQLPFKKVDQATGQPFDSDLPKYMNPPGHGSIYYDLYHSGILHKLQEKGVEYLFISNADNLAANVDPYIASYLQGSDIDFLIELTEKFDSDKKGGTVINYNGQLKLWESAQVADDQTQLFEEQPVFNTNNIWVNIESLIQTISKESLTLDLILNKKSDADHQWVQLEYAMGSAIQSFSNAQAMAVPRSRFFPIKKVSDYLLLLSDFTEFDDHSNLNWDLSKRPMIECHHPFQSVGSFDDYFSVIPSLKNVSHLEIGGELFFDSFVRLNGNLRLVVPDGQTVHINEQKDLDQFH